MFRSGLISVIYLVVGVVAIGLVAFGLYSITDARYRRI